MKNIKHTLLLFLMASTSIFTSCTDNVEPLDPAVVIPEPSSNGKFKVDIDGKTFVATNIQASLSANAIAITGLRSGSNDLLQITLPSPLNQVGTYTWENAIANNAVLGLIYSNASSEAFISVPNDGEFADFPAYVDNAVITISSIDTTNKTISGTFQFTGGRINLDGNLTIKKFTNGSFTEIGYTGEIPEPSGNTFLQN
ncbi:DUF6252 family protein [Flavobacterium sp.]|uniref:DUF6252 family protein n=1 Tax=Flavobacterium sp. TaxID=239 RepID=UPI00261778EA|nr:DUF6252 family protein [Flavobacterium sp.]MDD3004592.1 DUF6252 family protein [Flavobacterium sp.]